MTDETPTLEQRVAALEEAFPPQAIQVSPHGLTDEQAAQFRADLDTALAGPLEYRVLSPPPPLSRDEVRQLLSECVTVVKPGEVLILRARDGWTPDQVFEVGKYAAAWLEVNAPDVKALAIPPMEIAILPADVVRPS